MSPELQNRENILNVIRSRKEELSRLYGVTDIGVFGSVARGESRPESDVDVVVRMREPNLYSMVHIKEILEEALHAHIDIVRYREKMNPSLKKRIDRDAMYV